MPHSKPPAPCAEELKRLLAEGKTDREVGAAMGYGAETIRGWRVALKIKSNLLPKYSPPEKPLTAKAAKEPAWDFSKDNLDLPGGRFAK